LNDETRRRLGEWRRSWQATTSLTEEELDELAQHLREAASGLREEGLGEVEAFDRAVARLGAPEDVAREYEKARPRTRGAPVGRWYFDLRYAARKLVAHPVFTLVAVASIGVAIAANTLAFSVINGLLLRDPGYGASEALVEVYTGSIDDPSQQSVSSWPMVGDLRSYSELFEGVVGYEPLFGRMLSGGTYAPVFGEVVSGDFFDVLAVPMALGRSFTPDDATSEAAVAVLSYDTWRGRLGGRPDALGATVEVNGEPLTVIGVAPEGFRGAIPVFVSHVWVPIWMLPLGPQDEGSTGPAPAESRDRWMTQLKARLRPGVSAADAEAVLIRSADGLAASYPESYSEVRFRVIPTDDVSLSPAADGIAFPLAGGVLGVVAVVLMIASMNLAGFMLARGADRATELRLRQALGATRGRLMGQLFIESLMLSGLGAAVGLLLCEAALGVFARVELPIPILLDFDFSIDRSVLLYTVGVALAAAILFGLAPAWHSTRGEAGRGVAGSSGARLTGSGRIRAVLLTCQVAVSLLFLVWGGLLTRSFLAESRVDLGFRAAGAAVVTVELASSGYRVSDQPALLDRLRAEAGRRPELESVAFTTRVPLGSVTSSADVVLPGAVEPVPVEQFSVSPEYFDAMGIRPIDGRPVLASDRRDAAPVVVVSRSFAERYGGDGATVGASIEVDGTACEIVGIVEDVRVERPREGSTPHLYRPLGQTGAFLLSVVGVASGDSEAALRALESTLETVDPDVVVWSSATIEDQLSLTLMGPRIGAGLLVGAAAIALLLTVVGVFGTVSYAASRRAREMAIRLSLGATPDSVARLVALSMLRVIAVGAGVGLALSLAGTQVIRSLLFGVGPFDPVAFVLATALLAGTAVLAAMLPARRAGRTEVTTLLRDA